MFRPSRVPLVGWALAGVAALVAVTVLFPRLGITNSLALAVAVATITYAILSAALLEAQTRPYVVAFMNVRGSTVYLVIKNFGAGGARHVKPRLLGSLDRFPDSMASKAGFFESEIEFLAPGESVPVYLANAAGKIAGSGPGGAVKPEDWPRAEVKIEYQSEGGRSYASKYPLNLGDHRNASLIDLSMPPERIAKELEEIRKILAAK